MNLHKNPHFTGTVHSLWTNSVGCKNKAKTRVGAVHFNQFGIKGDKHATKVRLSGAREAMLYPSGTVLANNRGLSFASIEEISATLQGMHVNNLPEDDFGLFGVNIITSGIPNLTEIPPGSVLQFGCGLSAHITMKNTPCAGPTGEMAQNQHIGRIRANWFKKAAENKRGLLGSPLCIANSLPPITPGDRIDVYLPQTANLPCC